MHFGRMHRACAVTLSFEGRGLLRRELPPLSPLGSSLFVLCCVGFSSRKKAKSRGKIQKYISRFARAVARVRRGAAAARARPWLGHLVLS